MQVKIPTVLNFLSIKFDPIATADGPVNPEGINRVLQSVYHEIEHIYYPGEPSLEDAEDESYLIKYFLHPGEIRAFARQFGLWYHQSYPGEIFSLEKMQNLAQGTKDKRAIHYFIFFADPTKYQKYMKYGDVGTAHKKMALLTERFLNKLNSESIASSGRNNATQILGKTN